MMLEIYISSTPTMVLHTLYLHFGENLFTGFIGQKIMNLFSGYMLLQVMIRCDFLQTSGLFEEVDLSSYCIGISLNGPETIYSIGFVKTNNDEY
jgi:hypothetical protein